VSVGRLGSAAGPLLGAALLGTGRTPQEVLILLVPTIILSGIAVFVLVSIMGRRQVA
jgi:MFS transporter, AAHS family, 3-hydroxyphenylpropionic acid transporter